MGIALFWLHYCQKLAVGAFVAWLLVVWKWWVENAWRTRDAGRLKLSTPAVRDYTGVLMRGSVLGRFSSEFSSHGLTQDHYLQGKSASTSCMTSRIRENAFNHQNYMEKAIGFDPRFDEGKIRSLYVKIWGRWGYKLMQFNRSLRESNNIFVDFFSHRDRRKGFVLHLVQNFSII
jgi:hypothetical protein